MTDEKIKTKELRDKRIIALASKGIKVERIRDEVECSRNTVIKTIQSEWGQSQLSKTVSEMEQSFDDYLPKLVSLSFDTLREVMVSAKASEVAKVQAAKTVIDTALRLSEIGFKVAT